MLASCISTSCSLPFLSRGLIPPFYCTCSPKGHPFLAHAKLTQPMSSWPALPRWIPPTSPSHGYYEARFSFLVVLVSLTILLTQHFSAHASTAAVPTGSISLLPLSFSQPSHSCLQFSCIPPSLCPHSHSLHALLGADSGSRRPQS